MNGRAPAKPANYRKREGWRHGWFGIRDGHVGTIRRVDRPRSYHVEFSSETTSEAGPKGFEISQEDEAVIGGPLLICNIAGLTPMPPDPFFGPKDERELSFFNSPF